MSLLFSPFSALNVKNEDFDQPLECAAPKRWSKYTTCICKTILKTPQNGHNCNQTKIKYSYSPIC